MSVQALFVRLLWSLPLAHAARVGGAFTQYRDWICAPNFVPVILCDIARGGGAANILGIVTQFVTGLAAAVGVCVFIYACIRMVVAQGQDAKIAAAKRMAVIALIGVFLTLSVQPIILVLKKIFESFFPQ